ncbi:MAG TPA: choice-of-anchor V domain-containing protein [Candidatus Margulisiibacteriota bacterium]|nr:choice-of-anchor V domain-containing protein [Candidatus Margulisiibacteriota bacterium]
MTKFRSGRRPVCELVVCTAIVLLGVGGARGLETGITGNSGKQGATCDDDCHHGGVTPLVRFEGPTQVMADAIATFRFVVTSQSAKQTVAGFNVAASDGVLGVVAGQDEQLEFDELTHQAPNPNLNGEASWEFTWQAPSPGVYTLYGAGLSANNNGTDGGDDSNLTTVNITVTAGPVGDANCDARVTAADVTAVAARLSSGVPGDCVGVDANGDGSVTTDDVAVVVAALFGA